MTTIYESETASVTLTEIGSVYVVAVHHGTTLGPEIEELHATYGLYAEASAIAWWLASAIKRGVTVVELVNDRYCGLALSDVAVAHGGRLAGAR